MAFPYADIRTVVDSASVYIESKAVVTSRNEFVIAVRRDINLPALVTTIVGLPKGDIGARFFTVDVEDFT